MSSPAIPAAAQTSAAADNAGAAAVDSAAAAKMSIWEAATAGREIILDAATVHANATDAMDIQKARMAAAKTASMAKGANKKTAEPLYAPKTMEVVSGYQPEYREELNEFVKSDLIKELQARFDKGVPLGSSLPHLTPAASDRVEHVTSSRVVGTSGEYTIHERFHQNQGPRLGSEPSHDRFFATDGTGHVHTVSHTFQDPKTNHKLNQLYRATVDASRTDGARPLLNSTVHELVVWKVDGRVDDKSPPLSPRSTQRRLPDTGYGIPSAKHAK